MSDSRIEQQTGSVVSLPHRYRRTCLASAVSAVLTSAAMFGPTAVAQQSQESRAVVEGSQPALEEIIVTSRYREERLQETPIAITAMSSEEIELRGFTSAYEIAYTVPNASFRPAQAAFGNTMTAFIRSIGQYDFDFAFEPGVGVYIDDVYHPFTLGSQIELLDLERVEVLRGPQGTLFGRGAIGGAIRYITKKPLGDETGSISVTVGDYDRLDISASYDFSLTDTVFARISGVSQSREGYQDVIDFTCAFPELSGDLPQAPVNRGRGCKVGTQGGEDVIGGRAALRWVPGEDFELNLAADYQKDTSEAKADTLLAVNTASFPSFVPGVPYDNRFLPPDPYVSYATYSDPLSGLAFAPETEFEKWTVSGRGDWDITDGFNAALILAYTDILSSLVSDADGSPINMQQTQGIQTIDFMTAELRFSGRVWDRMDWTVGGFYYDGEAINDQVVSIPFLSLILDGVPPTDPSQPFVNAHNVHETSNESAFAHVVFDFTDQFSINAGVRYSSDEKDVNFDNTRVQNPNVVVKGNSTDWRVGLDYQWTDSVLTYASVATGYRPGSYNPRPFQATQVVAVDAEDSLAYEIGIKSDLFGDRLRLNVAAFYTDWETRITPVGGTECPLIDLGPPPVYVTVPEGTIDPSTGAPVAPDDLGNFCLNPKVSRTFYENNPGEITGAELEFILAATDALTISGAYGYTDWESADINDSPIVVSDRPTYVPKENWTVSATYAFNIDGGSSLTPRVDVYGQSEICTQTVFTTSLFPGASCSEAYELVNARIEWASPDRAWTVALGATNLADEEYFLNKFDLTAFGQPHAEGQPGQPRQWYVQFTRNFGSSY